MSRHYYYQIKFMSCYAEFLSSLGAQLFLFTEKYLEYIFVIVLESRKVPQVTINKVTNYLSVVTKLYYNRMNSDSQSIRALFRFNGFEKDSN